MPKKVKRSKSVKLYVVVVRWPVFLESTARETKRAAIEEAMDILQCPGVSTWSDLVAEGYSVARIDGTMRE